MPDPSGEPRGSPSHSLGPPTNATVTTEPIKLLAGGCQLIAVDTFVAAILASILNPAIITSPKTELMAASASSFFKLLALRFLD